MYRLVDEIGIKNEKGECSMDCPKCGTEMTMYVSVRLRLPSRYLHKITKGAIRSGDCKITAAFWEAARIQCDSCMYREKDI